MTKRIRHALLLTLVSVALVAIGCDARTAAKKSKTEHTTLRLRWLHQAQFAGIYWAQERGVFEKQGLKVDINPGGPGINFMQLVGSGAEEFGICGAAQVIEARSKGVPVVALALFFQGNPNIFFAKETSGIRSPRDWAGRTVGVQVGYDIEYVFLAVLKKVGLSRDKVEMYPAQIDLTPFFDDRVQVWSGYVLNQPLAAEEKGFKVTRFFPDDYGVHVVGDCLFTTEKVIQDKPDLCQRMVTALIEGWTAAVNNPDQAVDLVLSISPAADRAHQERMMREVQKLVRPPGNQTRIGEMKAADWEGMVKLWKEFGGIKRDVAPSGCYTTRFVDTYYGGK